MKKDILQSMREDIIYFIRKLEISKSKGSFDRTLKQANTLIENYLIYLKKESDGN